MSSGLIGLLAIVAAGAMFMGRDVSAQVNYFQPCNTLALSSDAPNAASGIIGTFGIGLDPASCAKFVTSKDRPPNWNSGGLIAFTPPEWKVAKDADIPDGTVVGEFKSKAVIGILNNACETVIEPVFTLYDGTIDRSKKLAPKAEGQPDRLSPMRDLDPKDGIPDSAVKWPAYLDNLPARNGMNMDDVIARFVGINTSAVTGLTIVLNFLVFKPGATVSDELLLDPRLGYPAVTILQDPSGTAANSDSVSDFCAPLWTSSSLSGQAGGAAFRTNPGAGSYNFVTYVLPQADVDEDGIENGLDPCTFVPNTSGWDPRAPFFPLQDNKNVGDKDGDGLPDECDPEPTVPSPCNAGTGISNADEDCDKWQNRGDNCSLVKNEDQKDNDGDGIGNACDTGTVTTAIPTTVTLDPEVANGRHLPVCLVQKVDIGGGGTVAVADPTKLAPCDPTAKLPVAATHTPVGQTPAPTLKPGAPTPVGGVGPGGAPVDGIGSLAPTAANAPVWATMLAAFGVIGVVIGFGLMGSRYLRRRE
ncbi:MAG: hypothetical protein AAB092_02480 [Chloroflexota bacterium]